MNVLNRLIVILGVFVLILFAVMAIVLAWAYSDETIERLGDFVTYLNDHNSDGTRVLITLGASLVSLIGLAFLVLELAPRNDKTVVVHDVETGSAVLSTVALGRRLEQIVMSLPEVGDARAKVVGKKKAVEVNLQVMVDPESDLASIASEVSRVTQDAVTRQMSVALAGPPRLRLYYSSRPVAVRHPAVPEKTASHAAAREAKSARKAGAGPGAVEGEESAASKAESQSQPNETPLESKEREQP